MPIYIVGNEKYNIPEEKVQEFLKAFPGAVLEQAKTAGVSMGAAAPIAKAPSMDYGLENGFLESQETNISPWQSIKNSFSNMFEQFGDIGEFWSGDSASMDLATAALAEQMLGRDTVKKIEDKYGKDAWVSQGIGLDEILQNISKLEKEKAQTKKTIGLVESFEKGDLGGVAAGAINAVVNGLGSVAYGIGTGMTGYIFDYAAENFVEHNKELAKKKGKKIDQLIIDKEAETLTPFAFALGQGALETVGVSKVLSPFVKGVGKSAFAKQITDVLKTGVTEASTEWGQYGLEQANRILAEKDGDVGETVGSTLKMMFTEQEALESALQGFVGGSGMRAGGLSLKGSNAVRTTEEANQISRGVNRLIGLNKILKEAEAEGNEENILKVKKQIDLTKRQVGDVVEKSNKRIQELSDKDQQKIVQINDEAVNTLSEIENLNDKFSKEEISKESYDFYLNEAKQKFNENNLKIKGILKANENGELAIDKSVKLGNFLADTLGLEIQQFKTSDEFATAANMSPERARSVGGAYIDGKIYINKESASKTLQINVAMHEILHPILNSQIGDATQQGRIVEGFKQRLTSSQRRQMENIMASRGYKESAEKYNTEYLNVFSDAIAKQELSLDKTILERLGDFIKSIFKQYDVEIGFENADQVFNFMSEYNKSIKEGEISDKVIKAIDQFKLQKEIDTKSKSGEQAQFSQADLNARVDNLVGPKDESGNYKVSKQQYDKDSIALIYDKIINGNMIDPLITRGISGNSVYGKPLDDFILDVKDELIGTIMRFNPEKNNSLIGFINSQLQYRKDDVLARYKKEAGTQSLDVEAGEVGYVGQIESDYNADDFELTQEETSQIEESRKDLVNPISMLDFPAKLDVDGTTARALKMTAEEVELYNNFNIEDVIADLDLAKLFLGNTPRLYDYAVAISMGINPKKIFDTGITLTGSEAFSAQQWIYNNIDNVLKILPDGATDKASGKAVDMFLNRGLNIPNNLLKAFYNKLDRITEGAGLYPFELKNNLTKDQALAVFGMLPDGRPMPGFGTRTPEAQSIKALATLVSRLASNTKLRLYAEAQDVDPMVIVNLREGVSQAQLSEDRSYLEPAIDVEQVDIESRSFKDFFENKDSRQAYSEIFAEKTGMNIDDALELSNVSKSKYGDQVFDIDKVKIAYKAALDFISFLPPEVFSKNKTIAYSLAGLHYRENAFSFLGFEFYLDPSTRKFISKNGKIIKKETAELKQVKDMLLKIQEAVDLRRKNLKYSENTKRLLSDYKKINGKKTITPNSNSFIANVNNKLKISVEEAVNYIQNRQKLNDQKILLANLIASLTSDYFENSNDKYRGVLAVQMIKNTANITEGFRGLTTIENVFEGLLFKDKKAKIEHGDSNVYIMTKFFNDVIIGGKKEFNPARIWVIDKEIADKTDSEIGRVASYDQRKSSLAQYSVSEQDLETTMGTILAQVDPRLSTAMQLDRATARNLAANRRKRRDILAPSADDFVGLLYRFLAKGEIGDKQYKFFEEKLIKPFGRAYYELNATTQNVSRAYKAIKKRNPDVVKKLKKDSGFGGFTYEQALRVWLFQKAGFTPNGLNEDTQKALINVVKRNKDIEKYGVEISGILPFQEFWVEPDAKNWQVDSIQSDVVKAVEKVSRKSTLTEWIENKNAIFSENNMNKIEAAFGPDFRSALEDMLYRMENGTARPEGLNKQMNEFLNWIRGSVAVTMFFNTRSAILQQISNINFLNWGDNNPIKAAAALANVDQYAKDFSYIFNSDYLKERRGGLKTDINAAELAEAIRKGGVKGLHAKMLQLGFSLTQIGDSIAIATGGATFYRNRTNTYISQGMDIQAAEKQAFLDFQEISEESQQSARPDRLAKQQTDIIGRVFLAFQNTPMQYTRIIVKAAKDLAAGRGDRKTNISKIVYYMAVQNIIFSSMQTALFGMLFDDEEDDDEKEMNEKKVQRVINNSLDTVIRGTGMYGAVLSTAKNTILKFIEQEKRQEEGKGRADHAYTMIEALNISPAIGIKAREMYGSIQNYRYNKDLVTEMGFNLNNPGLDIAGSASAFALNLPLDRAISKVRNLKAASDAETETWQAIALALGWNTWDVGIKNDELKEVKQQQKEQRKKTTSRRDPFTPSSKKRI